MASFANPANSSVDATREYVEALLALLGDREPVRVLAEMPAALAGAVAEVDPARLQRPEAPGKWSVAQVLAHLADSELVWSYRLRRVLAEERPTLEGYDQDRWADRLGYAQADVPAALTLFGALREANLRLLRRATPADRRRVGLHRERGEESVERMLQLYAAHDLVHRRQIDRIKATVA